MWCLVIPKTHWPLFYGKPISLCVYLPGCSGEGSLGINVRSVGIKIFIVILFSYLLVMENFEHTCKSREQIMNSHVPIIKFH